MIELIGDAVLGPKAISMALKTFSYMPPFPPYRCLFRYGGFPGFGKGLAAAIRCLRRMVVSAHCSRSHERKRAT
jgi:hypothetical protein